MQVPPATRWRHLRADCFGESGMWNWIGIRALAAGALVCLAAATPAGAQSQSTEGLLDRKLYDGRTLLNKNALRFCLATASPLRDLDRALGEAIAQIQLAHVEFYDVDLTIPQQDDDFDRLLFVSLTDHCDAMMGTDLAWSPLPEWLTVSRPYYSAPYVLAVRPNTYSSLGGVPPVGRIGSPLFSTGDQQLVTTLATMSADRRWSRVPYADVPSMLADVRSGKIDGGFFAAPLAGPAKSGQLDGLTLVSSAPVRVEPMRLGALFLSKNTFTRDAVDQAIDALQQDGTIDRVIAEQGLPTR
jgi:polar amino acid transport system substrate-binding protein